MALSELDDGNPAVRFDSEFFSRVSLSALHTVRRHAPLPLSELVSRIQHPLEVTREYHESGLRTLMAGSIRPNRADASNLPTMAVERSLVERNLLQENDVVLVRTGANFGTVAPWKSVAEVYACADLLIARSPEVPSGYLSSFLTGRYGEPLVKRCSYGSAQPHISPPYIGMIPVPRLGAVETAVDLLVDRAVALEGQAGGALAQAESDLLDALGLDDWSPPEPLSYTRSAAAVIEAGRLDAAYFAPKYDEMVERLRATGQSLAVGDDEAAFVARGSQPDYGECGLPVVNSKHVRTNRVILDAGNRLAAPGRVRIRRGDVLINGTGVGTIGRVAPYLHEQEAVPDNHVTVVRLAGIDPIFLSVFLNSPIGQHQIERMISGSSGQIELYPADIRRILIWRAPDEVQSRIAARVEQASFLEAESARLLGAAKRAVEIAIADDEASALAFVAEQENVNADPA